MKCCNTTSATFGHTKTYLLKKIQVSEEVQQISVLMRNPDMTANEIDKAGIRLFGSERSGIAGIFAGQKWAEVIQ